MKTVKIQFVDMPMEFDVNDNFILTMLRKHYEVELTENPDFLFYSFGGLEFLKKQDCVRIYVGGEPIIPNFNDCLLYTSIMIHFMWEMLMIISFQQKI